jgi:hypothetical protein
MKETFFPEKTQFILEAQKNGQKLLELVAILKLLAARPSEKIERALADWIAYSFARIEKETPLIPLATTTTQAWMIYIYSLKSPVSK